MGLFLDPREINIQKTFISIIYNKNQLAIFNTLKLKLGHFKALCFLSISLTTQQPVHSWFSPGCQHLKCLSHYNVQSMPMRKKIFGHAQNFSAYYSYFFTRYSHIFTHLYTLFTRLYTQLTAIHTFVHARGSFSAKVHK